jgi:hypothetical protein
MKKTLYSVRLTEEEERMHKAVAVYRGHTKSAMFRTWIRKAFNALPEEAKKS